MSDPVRTSLPGGRPQLHLAGFMGSGKSTVGRLVARRLLWNFLDLDGVIERHEGRPVGRIFAESGGQHFREVERHVLRQVVLKPATVVALGGGTLIDRDSRALCRERAAVVWLQCPLELLEKRLHNVAATRPLWGDREALQARFDERLAGYEAAEFCVDADATPEQVAERVVELVGATAPEHQ
ncbi:MAG: shikimate kinase [Acidobacteria bacterium]|nr:shikimate kinase [Acidobacteriota bacterium]